MAPRHMATQVRFDAWNHTSCETKQEIEIYRSRSLLLQFEDLSVSTEAKQYMGNGLIDRV